jgi:hypothetical protein
MGKGGPDGMFTPIRQVQQACRPVPGFPQGSPEAEVDNVQREIEKTEGDRRT